MREAGAEHPTGVEASAQPMMRESDLRLFGHRIKRARKAKGWSQGKLGKRVGINAYQQISRYERGLEEPGVLTAAKIADALGVSLDYLTGR